MPDYVVTRVTALLNRHGRPVNGTRILLLGLAYKAGTSDWRESPSVVVAERLLALGADVRAADPYLGPAPASAPPCRLVEFGPDALRECDLAIVLVDHPEFDASTIAEHAPLVFDTKGRMRGTAFAGEVL
jgi:UDP-N-acetyl-D-mannosaminuronate dehydrogenase